MDPDANIIFGSTFDEKLDGVMRVSVVATGIAAEGMAAKPRPNALSLVRPAAPKQLETAKVEPRPAALTRPAVANAQASGMSNLDISRQAESGFGELTMPDMPEADSQDEDEQEVAATAVGESAPLPLDQPETTGAGKNEAPFIAPAPTLPERRPLTSHSAAPADPMKAAEMANASGSGEAPKSGTRLFRAITGLGMSSKRDDAPEAAPAETRAAAPAPQPAAQPAVETPAKPVQARLGALNPGDRVRSSQKEDDLLDIPAFLRRQAN